MQVIDNDIAGIAAGRREFQRSIRNIVTRDRGICGTAGIMQIAVPVHDLEVIQQINALFRVIGRLRRGGEGRLGQNDSREFGVLRDDNDCAGIQDRIISRFGNRPPSFRIHNREQGFLLYVWVLCHIDLICARRRIRRCCHLHITQRKIRRRKRIVIAQPRK